MSSSSSSTKSYKTRNTKVIKLSNELLTICHKKGSFIKQPKSIKSIDQLNSSIFIFLYETICSTELIDKKLPCNSEEDETQNLQAIIDSLSLDVLHEDLSHLTGESIYNAIKLKSANLTSIEHLLDILKCINEWVSSRQDLNQENEFKIEPIKDEDIQVSPIKKEEPIKSKTPTKSPIKTPTLDLKELELKEELRQQEEEVFKEYMKQKEQEFKMNRLKQQTETSSGNSSLVSNEKHDDDDKSDTSLMLHQVNNFYQQLPKSNASFEPKLSDIQTISNEIKQMRFSLNNNLDNQQTKISNLLKTVYDDDLKDAKSIVKQSLNKYKNKSDLVNELYLNAFNTKPDSSRSSLTASRSSRSKGVLYPKTRWVKPVQKRSISCIDSKNKSIDSLYSRFTIGENGILSSLLEEFPYLYSSPETIHCLWEKHSKQIETFSKMHNEIENKFLKNESSRSAQHHLEESYKKQQMLMDIMRKDLQHIQRVQDMKRKTELENTMKSKQREQRIQSAKVKRYYDEFRLQHRARMLKKTTNEEMVFKKLFNESLKIQKERMLELKRYAKEKSELNTKQQLNQIESIENFYKTKFDLLNEQLSKEKQETVSREKAQHLVLTRMKTQVRKKLESDIRDLQDQMTQDNDAVHWREMDAKRIQNELYSANYYKPSSKTSTRK